MKSWRIIALVIVCIGASQCSRDAAPPPAAVSPPETKLPAVCKALTPDEAEALIKAKPDLAILDMRVETEWAAEGHIPGAQFTNFFRGELREHLSQIDRKKPCLIYCAIGERSKQTAVQMAELGFSELYVLTGGLNSWKAAEKPVVK